MLHRALRISPCAMSAIAGVSVWTGSVSARSNTGRSKGRSRHYRCRISQCHHHGDRHEQGDVPPGYLRTELSV